MSLRSSTGVKGECISAGSTSSETHRVKAVKITYKYSQRIIQCCCGAVPFTSDKTVYLCQSYAVMMNVTVFEQAPELKTGQQEGVLRGAGITKPAVETTN